MKVTPMKTVQDILAHEYLESWVVQELFKQALKQLLNSKYLSDENGSTYLQSSPDQMLEALRDTILSYAATQAIKEVGKLPPWFDDINVHVSLA